MQLGQPRVPEERLLRSITVLGLAASIVNVIVGGGIFVMPALLAAEVGTLAPAVHLVGGSAVLLVAAAFITIGRSVSRSGGAYAYVGAVLGPFGGYIAGVLNWLVGAFASAALLAALAAMVATVHPSLRTPAAGGALILVLYALPVSINLAALRVGTRLIIALTVVKLATLFLFLAVALPMVRLEYLEWTGPIRSMDLARGAIVAFFICVSAWILLHRSNGRGRQPRSARWQQIVAGLGASVLILC